jgi:altronate dehydratase
MASESLSLDAVCRLPAPDDNVAIAIRRLDPGTVLELLEGPRVLAHTVLEGHRFAVRSIKRGDSLLSWGLPFGTALSDIAAGDYVSNQSMLAALAIRDIKPPAKLPARPNFADRTEAFRFNESAFQPGTRVERVAAPRTFLGYRRPGSRGVGTRNTIVILGTTSRTASFARQLAARLQPLARVHPSIDGIVAIAHTEGGGQEEPNNAAEILRALAGFMVHPNVGAVLAIDYGLEPVNNIRLAAFMREREYALSDVPHRFLSLHRGLAAGLAEGEAIVREWLPKVAAAQRTPEPLSGLRIALQCGGSDAFSGVSGNPLAGAIVHEVIRHGGTGVLTETDEAIGAESYLLRNVRDAATAHALLGKIESFRERLRWHGVTAESNPSAGNKFRGLYNIALKSLGAVHKKDPRTRIEVVCDYADPLQGPGFYFMNGPGNDLEGVAGQIAAGCNLVLFVTGNGSITNFPFVPTLKITTTTRRHQLLIHEMDINAGRYLDGEAFETVATDAIEQTIATASGQRSKGERAGHSQVSIWRNWRQTDASHVAELKARPEPNGQPLPTVGPRPPGRGALAREGVTPPTPAIERTLHLFKTETGFATERVGLVLPTSLCAAQIARLAADRLNTHQIGRERGVTRFVALAHTEGCGFGGESMYHLLHRTYRGYLTHPNVAAALLLEHGCEKIPNDVMRRQLENAGVPLDRFGWASVQLDGGIAKALDRIEGWFLDRLTNSPLVEIQPTSLGAVTLAIMTAAAVTPTTAGALAKVADAVINNGGSVLLPESDPLLANPMFCQPLVGDAAIRATLSYGQPAIERGLHVVATESDHWVENLTGLGGCGAQIALTVVTGHSQQGHPLVPVLQVAESTERGRLPTDDIDAFLTGDPEADESALFSLLAAVAQSERVPVALSQGFVDFQLTRGLLGVTT